MNRPASLALLGLTLCTTVANASPTLKKTVGTASKRPPITFRKTTIARTLDNATMLAMVARSKTVNHGWYTLDGKGQRSPASPNFSELDLKDLPFVVWSDNDRPGGNYQAFRQQNPGWESFVGFTLGSSLK